MKKNLILLLIFLWRFSCSAQTLNLEISNPQPRVGQSFDVSVNMDTLASGFFKPLYSKFKVISTGTTAGSSPQFKASIEATKMGKYEVGPFAFEFDGIKYTTSKVSFEVVDSLPNVNEGIWVRNVMINDSTFCILIDQRTPAHAVSNGNNSLSFSGQDTSSEISIVDENISNARNDGSSTSSSPKFLSGSIDNFVSAFFGNYRFVITDKSKPVVISRSAFKNLPAGYKFKDILIKP